MEERRLGGTPGEKDAVARAEKNLASQASLCVPLVSGGYFVWRDGCSEVSLLASRQRNAPRFGDPLQLALLGGYEPAHVPDKEDPIRKRTNKAKRRRPL